MAFEKLSEDLRGEFAKRFPFQADTDVSPDLVALRDAFAAFPVPVDVLLLDVEGHSNPFSTSPVWTLIRYDITRPRTLEVRDHGLVALDDVSKQGELLKDVFGLDGPGDLDSLCTLSFRGASAEDVSWYVDFVPFDIRENEKKYASWLFTALFEFDMGRLAKRFERALDFRSIYDLKPDPPLSDEELLTIHPTTACFVSIDTRRSASLSERHTAVAAIQLIPTVPESVARTFRLAKRLYIFGYFEYGFFTAADHYAYLALEAAVYSVWGWTLSSPVEVVHLDRRSKMEEKLTFERTHHLGLRNHFERAGWSPRDVSVNGRRFPLGTQRILDWLETDKVIGRWQRQRIENCLKLRNHLSHLEFAPLHSPSCGSLAIVSGLINELFHSVRKEIEAYNTHPLEDFPAAAPVARS